jgi:hypothetical protein
VDTRIITIIIIIIITIIIIIIIITIIIIIIIAYLVPGADHGGTGDEHQEVQEALPVRGTPGTRGRLVIGEPRVDR